MIASTSKASVTEVQGRGQVWGTPKSNEQREVPIPRFLIEDLNANPTAAGKS